MATFEEHCAEDAEKLGKSFPYVHRWLDEFAETLGPEHRALRHNEGGIKYVRRTWGDQAAQSATLHIKRDLGSFSLNHRVWVPSKTSTPSNR